MKLKTVDDPCDAVFFVISDGKPVMLDDSKVVNAPIVLEAFAAVFGSNEAMPLSVVVTYLSAVE